MPTTIMFRERRRRADLIADVRSHFLNRRVCNIAGFRCHGSDHVNRHRCTAQRPSSKLVTAWKETQVISVPT
jgi:hypothetical protein